jgi:hypothetical protein
MIIRSAIAWLVFVIGASLIVAFVRPISDRLMPIPSVFVDRDMREATPTDLLPTLHGIATHYDAERNGETTWYTRAGIEFYGAAGPDLRKEVAHEWRNRYRVIVSSKKTGRAVIVWIVDFCECRGGDKNPKNDRLVDLAPAVWDALGVPLHLGVMPITIELLP